MEVSVIQIAIAIITTIVAVFVVVRNIIGKEETAFVVNAAGKKVEFTLVDNSWEIRNQEAEKEDVHIRQNLQTVIDALPTTSKVSSASAPPADVSSVNYLFVGSEPGSALQQISKMQTDQYTRYIFDQYVNSHFKSADLHSWVPVPGTPNFVDEFTQSGWPILNQQAVSEQRNRIAYAMFILSKAGFDVSSLDAARLAGKNR
jgi:hypothetical protein